MGGACILMFLSVVLSLRSLILEHQQRKEQSRIAQAVISGNMEEAAKLSHAYMDKWMHGS